jgi:hypothetical protein
MTNLTMSMFLTKEDLEEARAKEELEGKCHAVWLLNGGETGKWNGVTCNCEYIQGNLNCRLNQF